MKLLKYTACVLTFFGLFMGSPLYASEDDVKNLSAQELNQLIHSEQKVFLLNPLPSLLFNQGHIPGSVNIRWHSLEGSDLMPEDKNTPIVTYCMGPR